VSTGAVAATVFYTYLFIKKSSTVLAAGTTNNRLMVAITPVARRTEGGSGRYCGYGKGTDRKGKPGAECPKA